MPHQKKANAGMHSTPHPPCHRITRQSQALAGHGNYVDTLVLARDCVRLAGVPEEVAHAVYGAELDYVMSR
jgi:hypothetical protein